MLSRSASNRVATYNALPPPKKQKKFPERRRSAKPRASIPRLRKSQSTLTQLDFVTPTSSRVEVIDSSSDEDLEDPRPKKKRRKSKFGEREAGQSTLTQFDRELSARKAKDTDVDEDGLQIWEDCDADMMMDGIAERQNKRRRTLPWLRENVEAIENREPTPEIPETSQNVVKSPGKAISDESRASVIFQTPRKLCFQEVPSSPTPPSTVGSATALAASNRTERSPLKARSSNVQSVQAIAGPSPESQNVSMKMLEKIRCKARKVPLNDAEMRQISSENVSAAVDSASTELDSTIQHGPMSLSRMDTVQDSQSEDAELSHINSAETVAVQPRRKLQRVSTVQDSQYDDEDFMSDSDDNDDVDYIESNLIEESQSQYARLNTQQDYFDPANSALDRDALRFGCTQTQRHLSDIDEEDADDETDDEDLDRGCVRAMFDHANVRDMNAQSKAPKQPSGMLAQVEIDTRPAPVLKPYDLHARRPDSRDDSAYESGKLTPREEVQVLSSSPPLRPSQISTVVPTQASLPQPHMREDSSSLIPQLAPMVEPLTFPISPHKPIHHSQILSSSPFQLPPWSSPDRLRFADKGPEEDESPVQSSQLARLVDYSLPPPPLLNSSRRQTPVSSST